MYYFRKAEKQDVSLIKNLADKIFPVTFEKIISKDQNDYMMKMMYSQDVISNVILSKDSNYYIFYNEGKPSGYLHISFLKGNRYQLDKIYLLPELHGKGFGKIMFKRVLSIVSDEFKAPFEIQLHVNRQNSAIKFYESQGMFVELVNDFPIGNGYFMNDYIMVLKVN